MGIVIAEGHPHSLSFWFVLTLGAFALSLWGSIASSFLRPLLPLWVVLSFVGAGGVLHTFAQPSMPIEGALGRPTTLLVQLDDAPRATTRCFKSPAQVLQYRDSSGWHTGRGRVMLYVSQDSLSAQLAFGQQLLVRAIPQKPRRLPGQFDYPSYLRHQGILLQCYVPAGSWSWVDTCKAQGLLAWSRHLQHRLLGRLRQASLSPSQLGIAEALLLGWRQDLDPHTQQLYRNAGITHLLCVSGLHVGWVAALITLFLFFIGNRWWQRLVKAIVSLMGIWLFVLITGCAPATLRAGIMFSLLVVGHLISPHGSSANNLVLAALIMLVARPMLLFDVGFQLSFAAVSGIMAMYGPLSRLIPFPSSDQRDRQRKLAPSNRQLALVALGQALLVCLQRLWQFICLSFAAQMATLPFTLYYFHQFPLYFLVANVVVVPFAGLLMVTLLLVVLWGPTSVAGEWMTHLLAQQLRAIDAATAWVGSLPHAMIDNLSVNLPQAVMIALVVALFAWACRRWIPSTKTSVSFSLIQFLRWCCMLLLVLIVMVAYHKWWA